MHSEKSVVFSAAVFCDNAQRTEFMSNRECGEPRNPHCQKASPRLTIVT